MPKTWGNAFIKEMFCMLGNTSRCRQQTPSFQWFTILRRGVPFHVLLWSSALCSQDQVMFCLVPARMLECSELSWPQGRGRNSHLIARHFTPANSVTKDCHTARPGARGLAWPLTAGEGGAWALRRNGPARHIPLRAWFLETRTGPTLQTTPVLLRLCPRRQQFALLGSKPASAVLWPLPPTSRPKGLCPPVEMTSVKPGSW